MRIIAGQWRGRPLVAPKGAVTRPTADRARETLFSMLYSRLGSFEQLSVADLFAGSGALGFEALSRGAASCLFVDQDPVAIAAIAANAQALGAGDRTQVRRTSVLALGTAAVPLDLVLLDPPYGTGAGAVALDKLARLGWVGPGTWASVETAHDEELTVPGYVVEADRRVGKARLRLLRRA